jgi:hypothetical protein
MDPSDRIRALQGKYVTRDFERKLAEQRYTQPGVCGGLSTAVVRYPAYELREQVRDGLRAFTTDPTCSTCTTTVCANEPYKGRTVQPPGGLYYY